MCIRDSFTTSADYIGFQKRRINLVDLPTITNSVVCVLVSPLWLEQQALPAQKRAGMAGLPGLTGLTGLDRTPDSTPAVCSTDSVTHSKQGPVLCGLGWAPVELRLSSRFFPLSVLRYGLFDSK